MKQAKKKKKKHSIPGKFLLRFFIYLFIIFIHPTLYMDVDDDYDDVFFSLFVDGDDAWNGKKIIISNRCCVYNTRIWLVQILI